MALWREGLPLISAANSALFSPYFPKRVYRLPVKNMARAQMLKVGDISGFITGLVLSRVLTFGA